MSRARRHVECTRRVATPVNEALEVGALLEDVTIPIAVRGVPEGRRYVALSVGVVRHGRLLW
ncbi:hypothetical protein [Natrinema sp. SYSU A 869]|uniref:hypothetical protein n=1 Tax=Natrinema sp. SYSU A 869 TaxID=2871694 RepID=UPI0021067351|nr:hypothetical protein [Natrinema sp. SYSU A 869]